MPRTCIVLNIYGGLVQDVFCTDPHAEVILVDWDTECCDPSEPSLVEVPSCGGPRLVHVVQRDVQPFGELSGTDAAAAIVAAHTPRSGRRRYRHPLS